MKAILLVVIAVTLAIGHAVQAQDLGETATLTKPFSTQGSSMKGSAMKGTSMKGTSMKGTSMKGSSMKGTSMKGSSMKGSSMKGTSMKGSSMKGTSMKGTSTKDVSTAPHPLANALRDQVVVEKEDPRPPAPPQEPPKLIELPQSKEAPVAKQSPPTLFILKDGGRVESRRYLLTDQSLKIEDGRQQHTIPLSALDLDATIAVNRERGIEVTIPRDRNTVFLSF